jgi:hypothetical protein
MLSMSTTRVQQQLRELPAFDADIDATQRMARLREVLAHLDQLTGPRSCSN